MQKLKVPISKKTFLQGTIKRNPINTFYLLDLALKTFKSGNKSTNNDKPSIYST